jgi:predicted metalloprotease with PDZ domain
VTALAAVLLLLEPIHYTLRFPAPETHYVEVEATVPTEGRPSIELFMAVWTPGSYLVREYERHVEGVTATAAGRPQAVVKTRKNRWKIDTGGAATVTVRYRVYGREMTVRNNWIDAGMAILNGAPTFLSLADSAPRPHDVTIEKPAAWSTISTALEPVAGRANTYRADDYDTLVDSPITLGNPLTRTFMVDGRPHTLVFGGDHQFVDADRAAADVEKIVKAGGQVMGRYAYPHYHFLNMVTGVGGGLEHKNSFLTMSNLYITRTRGAYLDWLSLVAHEYFHNWNVKRLRPVELGPFDYENERQTTMLWVAEGFTDYYGDLLVRRAGLSSDAEYLSALSGSIAAVQNTPGRQVTPVNMASYDTWIKQYRPDENTANTTIDYYPKGAVIAFLLDAKIREATKGAKTLDDGMALAFQRYGGDKGYTPDEFYETMSEVAGTDLTPFFRSAAERTDELDFTGAFTYYGLRFRPSSPTGVADLGALTKIDAGRLVVSGVRRGTPAIAAGINVDDEILAIDGVRVRADGLTARLAQYRPGDKIQVMVARRDRVMTLGVTLGDTPSTQWQLEVAPNITTEQRARLVNWLK